MPKKDDNWWATLTEEEAERETDNELIIKQLVDQSSTKVDIFIIRSKREILETTTFKNPFHLLGRIIYPTAKIKTFMGDDGIDNGGIAMKLDDIDITDYLRNSPYSVSRNPHFELNEEKTAKRTTQGVVTEHLKPIIEKRWLYNFGNDIVVSESSKESDKSNKSDKPNKPNKTNKTKKHRKPNRRESDDGYDGSNESNHSGESRKVGGIGSSDDDDDIVSDMESSSNSLNYDADMDERGNKGNFKTVVKQLKKGLGFIPISPKNKNKANNDDDDDDDEDDDIERIEAKPFDIKDFAKYVKKTEKDNTEMNSFLYSTLMSYIADEYPDIRNLVIIEVPTLNVDSAVSSDISRVSSDRSEYGDNHTRETLLRQTIEDIPLIYIGMHGFKLLVKNNKTRTLECRNMFRNPFQNLFRLISASPTAGNPYNASTINQGVFTTPFPNTLTIEEATDKIYSKFPLDDADTNPDIFTYHNVRLDNGRRKKDAFFIEYDKRNQFVVNYSNTYVCKKLFTLPEKPVQDLDNWGIFVLNSQSHPNVAKYVNMLRSQHFRRFIQSRHQLYENDFNVEKVKTTQGQTVEVISRLTNKILLDYFWFLNYKQVYLIDTSCEESYHMTKEDKKKFVKAVEKNEYKIRDKYIRYTTLKSKPFKEAYEKQLNEKLLIRRDKEHYKRLGIEGLNDLIDYNDKRAKTRKRNRFLSVISNNRGKFI